VVEIQYAKSLIQSRPPGQFADETLQKLNVREVWAVFHELFHQFFTLLSAFVRYFASGRGVVFSPFNAGWMSKESRPATSGLKKRRMP
jgi:hypothetical protein